MLMQRLATSIVLAPLLFWMISFNSPNYGSLPSFLLIVAIGVMSLSEIFHMLSNKYQRPVELLGFLLLLFLFVLSFMREVSFLWNSLLFFVISGLLVSYFLYELYRKKLFFMGSPLFLSVRGVFYIAWMMVYMYLIRNGSNGVQYFVGMMVMIWAGDSAAYFIGSKWGKRKLSPDISPNKTIEGSLAALVATIVVSFILLGYQIGFVHAFVLGSLVSVFGQLGDLYESLLKRKCEVKDSGALLPGHGGILDRMDSFIFASPIFYYYILMWGL
jgi:phosphatidate cytidylyltransferase